MRLKPNPWHLKGKNSASEQAENSLATNVEEGKTSAFDRALATWQAPRFLRYPRTKLWFLGMSLSCGLLIAYAIFTEAWSMLAVFVILPMVLLLEHRHQPENVEVVVGEYGIRYGEIRLPYSQIQKFWISHHPPMVDELHLMVESRWLPEVVVPLMGRDPAIIRQFLVTQIPEWEGKTLSAMDVFIRLLRLN